MPLYRTTASLLQALDGPEQEDVHMLAVATNTAHRAAVVLAVLTVLVVCMYTCIDRYTHKFSDVRPAAFVQ